MSKRVPWSFNIRAEGSSAGGPCNDDAYGAADQYLWIVDGATNVGPVRCTRSASDAAWLAGAISRWLHAEAVGESVRPVSGLLQGLEAYLMSAFAAEMGAMGLAKVDYRDAPTACLGLVRISNGALEVACVGDVTIAILMPNGDLRLFTDKGVEFCAAKTLASLREARSAGLSGEALRQQIQPILYANRTFANQGNGYRIVHPQQSWAKGVVVHFLPVEKNARVMLATDGLWRLVNVFRDCDARGLADRLERTGFNSVVERLRTVERGDPDGSAFLRVKCSDDATGVLALAQSQPPMPLGEF
nr:PP2C family serine/threonine-protein phosphatase [uncultured Albidiferax sp.]